MTICPTITYTSDNRSSILVSKYMTFANPPDDSFRTVSTKRKAKDGGACPFHLSYTGGERVVMLKVADRNPKQFGCSL